MDTSSHDPKTVLLSIPDVAERIGKSDESVLRRYTRGKGMPWFKLGGEWRITEADLASWIAEQREAASP